jgi:phosphoglycolate phosphatase
MGAESSRFRLLICDLDNTLYDWVAYFVPSFYAMVDVAVHLLSCDRERLLDEFREVHQRHHDSEHPFALLETRTVAERFAGWPRREVARALDPALHAFNSARRTHLRLHPNVRETLDYIRRQGIRLVAHTDSQLFGMIDRMTRLGLTDAFSAIYCRERPNSVHPFDEEGPGSFRDFPLDRVRELSRHQLKPDPTVLDEICSTESVERPQVAYVGDSVARDILMAKRAGVFSMWAKYGAAHDPTSYERLVRITHWTAEEVEMERRLKREAESIRPDRVLEVSFAETLGVLFPSHGAGVDKIVPA